MSDQAPTDTTRFADLGLPEFLLQALNVVGYENPSPIQAQTIPPLLQGRDLLGQAQTGTGKTAAFALPMLAQIDVHSRATQALVLAPTRELAIQVAEAFQKYAVSLPGFHVLPIYGGQSYQPQLSALKRGAHVVVGTPGRVMDHLKRGTLNLSTVKMVALDEADEMLNMGFLEDVEWILKHLPEQRQVALFSATMPNQIKRIAQTYLKDPAEVLIRSKTTTAANIRQRYWMVSGLHKMDALTRMLEVESFDAMLIFARTKVATEEIAEKLESRGYSCAPLNGDIPQQQRERTVQRLRDGQLDIIVATDVAARGLNVERISHVLNYDIPMDIESYVHRIGRTGRAGRSGEAILFVSPREKRMLFSIERATRQPIEHMQMPTADDVNNQRIVRFKQRITDTLAAGELELFRDVVTQYEQEHNVPAIELAAALAKMAQGKTPLLLRTGPRERNDERRTERSTRQVVPGARMPTEFASPAMQEARTEVATPAQAPAFDPSVRATRPAPERARAEAPRGSKRAAFDDQPPPAFARDDQPARASVNMQTYRVAVGHEHQVKPGNIVGAIANEAGIDSKHIGKIEIFDNYSLVDLPEGMPREILQHLKKVWVAGQELRISLQSPGVPSRDASARPDRDATDRPTGFRARRSMTGDDSRRPSGEFSRPFQRRSDAPRGDAVRSPAGERPNRFARSDRSTDRSNDRPRSSAPRSAAPRAFADRPFAKKAPRKRP